MSNQFPSIIRSSLQLNDTSIVTSGILDHRFLKSLTNQKRISSYIKSTQMVFIIGYRGKKRDEEDKIITTLTLFEGSSEIRFEKSEGYFQNCSLA